ncbi:MAG: serine/threonine-protein kinase [Verrucomicrobiales bacterium]
MACSPTDGAPGRFPGYILERRIGRGGMGATVYLARQISTGANVAIKVLPEEFAGDAAVARRFDREIRVMRSLRHPNVVRVVDSGGLPDGARFIVMEYLPSGSLARHLKEGKRFETASAVELIAKACRALSMMHDCGIIHRDIKPSNILLERSGNPKLCDFGLARLADASGSSRLTESGDVIGTFGYMAPEQLQAKAKIEGRADIYSLGAVLYQLLTGSIPGGNARLPSVMRQDAAPFDAVVMRALETDPARRFATAEGFRQALLAAPDLNRRQAFRRIVVGGIALAGIATGAWGVWRSR